ncbi:MAG: hypothetical protein ACFFB5_09320 [Promethearchaeota archaeon]
MVGLSDSEKLILLFLYDWERPIRAGDLFQILNEEYHFDRSRQTLHSLIKKLQKNKLISWEPHKLVGLTEIGKEHALHITWHMHLLENYFQETLDLTASVRRKVALRLTPIVSCEFIEAITKFHQDDCELKEAIKAGNLCTAESKIEEGGYSE